MQKDLRASRPPEVGEGLAAPVQRQQATLLQRLGLELPEHVRGDAIVPDQTEREGVLGLHSSQPGRRVEHGGQAVALGQLAGLGGHAAGDPLELVAAGQVVLDDDEGPLQLDRDLHDGRQDDDEGPGRLAGRDGRVQGLDDLDVVQELVEVAEHEDRRAVGIRHGPQRPDGRQRVAGADGGARVGAPAVQVQAAVDVPGGQVPALLAAEAGDLGDRVVVLERLDPQAGEGGATNSDKRSASVMKFLLLVVTDRMGRGWLDRGGAIVSVVVGAAGFQEEFDLRPWGQDQEREPVVAAVELQAEQVIDLAGVEQARLEPPPGEPAEDVAQVRRRVFSRRDAGPEDEGAAAALDEGQRKLIVPPPRHELIGRLDYRLSEDGIQGPELCVGLGGGRLDASEAADQLGPVGHSRTQSAEVLERLVPFAPRRARRPGP